MKKFTNKDLKLSILTGVMTGVVFWRILLFLEAPTFGFPHVFFIVIVPILWIVGVNFGYFLGQWIPFFNQFGRFAAVGFTNAALDFGVLNLQIGLTGVADGWQYSVFKTVSFLVGVTNSYIFNKIWVFDAVQSEGGKTEMIKFVLVNVVAILFNVGIASFVVNYITPFGGLGDRSWANIGAMVGSGCAIFLTFIGARMIVFKANKPVS